MTTTTAMLDSNPKNVGDLDRAALATAVDAASECARTCAACADACLPENMVAGLINSTRTT
jgi:hypothetical protein